MHLHRFEFVGESSDLRLRDVHLLLSVFQITLQLHVGTESGSSRY